MSTIRARARRAGLLYQLMGIPGAVGLLYIPTFIVVPGDAAATARNILASDVTYRLVVLCGLISCIGFSLLAISLYNLFKDVERMQAMALVMFVVIGAAFGLVNLINQIAPLVILKSADVLSAFSRPQLDALAFGFLRLWGNGNLIVSAFWGLWLYPFGVLVMRSRFIPKILGMFLVMGCFAYLAVSFLSIVFPPLRPIVSRMATPFYAMAEGPIALWLLIKGAKEQPDGV